MRPDDFAPVRGMCVHSGVVSHVAFEYYDRMDTQHPDDHQPQMQPYTPSPPSLPLLEDVALTWQVHIPRKEKIEPLICDPLIQPRQVKCFQPQVQQA